MKHQYILTYEQGEQLKELKDRIISQADLAKQNLYNWGALVRIEELADEIGKILDDE